MSSLTILGDTSGSVLLQAPAIAGSTTLTLPSTSGTLNVAGPAFSVYISANQTISNNTLTKIPFDTKEFDTASCFNTSTYRFTPNVAGYYQLNWSSNLYTAGTGEVYTQLFKNNTGWKTGPDLSATNQWNTNGCCLVYANGTTDYFEVYCYQNTGSSKTLYGTSIYTVFSGFLARTA
jgi:hypothetical protein